MAGFVDLNLKVPLILAIVMAELSMKKVFIGRLITRFLTTLLLLTLLTALVGKLVYQVGKIIPFFVLI